MPNFTIVALHNVYTGTVLQTNLQLHDSETLVLHMSSGDFMTQFAEVLFLPKSLGNDLKATDP